MSREQQVEAQGQFDQGSPEAAAPVGAPHLPMPIYQQAAQIQPGDVEALQALLSQYPDYAQAIATVASHHAGMSTVKQAMAAPRGKPELQKDYRPGGEMELESTSPKPAAGKPELQKDYRPGGEMELESTSSRPAAGKPELQKDYRPGGEVELESTSPTKATATETKAKAEPAWVVAARRYNDAHMALVDEFNNLTDGKFALDDENTNPVQISQWQIQHGLPGDGMVGPKTVAAARAARDNAGHVAKASTPEKKGELIDV